MQENDNNNQYEEVRNAPIVSPNNCGSIKNINFH